MLAAATAAILLSASAGFGADPAAAPQGPQGWAWLLPGRIQAGPQFALTGSRFEASPDYKALVQPTASEDRPRPTPGLGAFATARWGRWFSLTVSPRRETYALETREETVSFPDNPFPHTLKASTELTYNVWPLILGFGWTVHRHRWELRLGTYAALYKSGEIRWTVDGERYANMPYHEVSASHSGSLLGAEYGFRLGGGELLVGLEAKRGTGTLLEGMRGSLKARSASASLAYAFIILDRP